MKTSIKFILLLLLVTFAQSCGNDDDNSTPSLPEQEEMEETANLVGDWNLISGNFVMADAKFLKINEGFVNLLFQDDLGFKNERRGNFSFTDTQMTIELGGYFGIKIYNYTLTETSLTLVSSAGDSATFNRLTSPIDAEGWIKETSIISQGDAPWNEMADIAFNGTHILLGNGYQADNIGLINTSTIELDGELITTESAFAVEVEKYVGPDRYIFQSDNGFSKIKAYREDTGAIAFTSIDIGQWIHGIASIDSESAWVFSNNDKTLNLYNYGVATGETITTTIPIDQSINGLDYQNDLLYMCGNGFIYICETLPEFRVVESIELEGYQVYGIAYDGSNFWLNAKSSSEESNQIIKTNLTL